jgi:hypothetical protein
MHLPWELFEMDRLKYFELPKAIEAEDENTIAYLKTRIILLDHSPAMVDYRSTMWYYDCCPFVINGD